MIKLMMGITLRHGDGIWFGTVVRIGGSRFGLFCDGEFREGDFLEWQIELTGWDLTISGVGEVCKADLRAGGLHRYLVQIIEMRRSDREMLEAWYGECAEGGEGGRERLLDRDVGSCAPPPRSDLRTGSQKASTRRVEDPAQARWSTLPSLSVSGTADGGGCRREALRAVLRAAFRENLPPEDRRGTQGEGTVVVLVHGWLTPPLVELRYPDEVSWRADWQAWLRQGLAFARGGGGALALDESVSVRLVLPRRVDITCPARVVVLHSSGFGMALDLNPQQEELLRSISTEARGPAGRPADRPDLGTDARSPLGRAFWARLFGIELVPDPLEEAIADLGDPLAPLDLGPARNRRRLVDILGHAERNYLVLCDQVAALLGEVGWRWPELEELTRASRKPLAEATAHIVLAHVVRREAVAALRDVAAEASAARVLVEVTSEGGPPCSICRPYMGNPRTPLDLVRSGLPPYHLGCRCRITRT